MKTHTLGMIVLASVCARAPALSPASDASLLDRCASAFVTDLSNQSTSMLKLRESHYEADAAFMPFGESSHSLTLTARDPHDNHALARAACTINSHGEVDLRAEPLVADNLH